MRRVLKRLTCLLCGAALVSGMPLTVSADSLFPGSVEQPTGGTTLDGLWTYNDYHDGTFSVKCNDTTVVNAEVPEKINGKTVNMIELDAFKDNTALETVTLPSTITHIEDWAFSGCTSLKSINLPNGLERIDYQAFYGCSSLEEITIPASTELIDIFVFEGCSSMQAIHVSDGNGSYIDQDGVLFDKAMSTLIFYPPCKPDTAYDIPDGCTTIEDWAFVGSTALESIDLTGVTSIGEDAFYYCTSLKSVAVPEGITELASTAFGSCYALEEVTLPSTLDVIGEFAFYNCLALKTVNIPGRVDTIKTCAFLNCPELKSLTIYDAVKTIGDYAFGFCIDADTQKYIRTPDFVLDTHNGTAAHEYCAVNDLKSTGGVTQSSVFLTVIIIIVVLVIAATVAIIIIQKHIQKRYELR